MNLIKDKWSKKDGVEFQEYLKSLGDEKNAPWKQRIINTKLPCLAINSPVITDIAKQIEKGNFLSFIDLWLWDFFEDTSVICILLGKIKDFDLYKSYLIKYISKADNWATVDSLKFKINKNNKTQFFDFAVSLLNSELPFVRRTGLGIFMKFVDDDSYIDKILNYIDMFESETEYYVNMMNAWLLCDCFIKQREKTLAFLKKAHLNNFTINKTVSKCRDSFRVSKEDKDFLLGFKRK